MSKDKRRLLQRIAVLYAIFSPIIYTGSVLLAIKRKNKSKVDKMSSDKNDEKDFPESN